MRNVFEFDPRAGLNLDINPDKLPAGAVSNAMNYMPGEVRALRATAFTESDLTCPNESSFILQYQAVNNRNLWFVAGATTIQRMEGINATDVTRDSGPYTGEALDWNGINFNGVAILNNITDKPQYYDESTGKFVDMPNFPQNTTFSFLGYYKNYLIGLGTVNQDGYFASEIFWSSPAAPGAVPPSWDVTIGGQAGTTTLPSRGRMMACLELGQNNIIYKSDSIWVQRFTAGEFTFDFEKVFDNVGLFSPRLVARVEDRHVLVTSDDIIVHDGMRKESIGRNRVSKYFFRHLNAEYKAAFMLTDYTNKRLWICFPTGQNTQCDMALIWDWQKDSWGVKQFNIPVSYSAFGKRPTIDDAWDNTVGDWDRDGQWDIPGGDIESPIPFFSTKNGEKFLELSPDGSEAGGNPDFIMERSCIPLGSLTRDGVIIPNYRQIKVVAQLFLDLVASSPVRVQVGYQDDLDRGIVWETDTMFDPAIDDHIDTFISGRFIAVRISGKASKIEVQRMAIEFELGGQF